MTFYNGRGRQIAEIDSRDDERRYGSTGLILKRSRLRGRSATRRRGTASAWSTRRSSSTSRSSAAGRRRPAGRRPLRGRHPGARRLPDRRRRPPLAGPQADPARTPRERPTAASSTAASSPTRRPARLSPGRMEMTFGHRAFFGAIARPDGEVCWFSNLRWPRSRSAANWPPSPRTSGASGSSRASDDHEPIQTLIRSTPGTLGRWGVYELPSLPTWHRGRSA